MMKTTLKYINLIMLILFCSVCLANIFNVEGVTVYQDIIDEITNSKKEAVYNVDLNAPFTKEKSGIREMIDPETGELSIKCDIFDIQGRAGNNLDLSLMYRTSISNTKEENAEITTTTAGTTTSRNILKDKTNFEKSQTYFGTGWQLYFPYIEQQNEDNKTNVYVHMPNGTVYLKDATNSAGLKDYKLSDMQFNTESVTKDGITFSFRIIYADGTIYYFTSDGYLAQKVDKYNNTVFYDWITKDNLKLIKYITDNSSRKIIFEYDDKDITVSYENQKYRFIRTPIDGETGAYYLSAIIDPMGRKTNFSYYAQSIAYNFFVTSSPYPASVEATNNYHILNQVIYPTNVKSVYEYTKSKKWLYEAQNGYIEYVKLQKRYDESDKISNLLRYEYGREPDGYPDYKRTSLPENYTYQVNEIDSIDTRNTYSYNSKHDLFSKEKWTQSKQVSREIKIFDDELRMPENTIITNYNDNNDKQETHIDTSYDNRGNILKSDTYEKNEGGGKYVKEYQYSNNFNLCLYESYKKDASTKIEVKRDFDGGGTNIGSEKIVENGRVIQNIFYKYDSLGNLTEKKIETDKDQYSVTAYEYSEKYNKLYPTVIKSKGVINADGESEDLKTTLEYDKYGNVTASYDAEGNKKAYEYDMLNRKTKEILEDKTNRTTKYDDKQNIIETIDAVGTKLKYNYDFFGKLTSVTDVKKSTELLNREYDNKDRIVKETNAKGTEKSYEYDYLDRIINLKFVDSKGTILTNKDINYDTAYQENNRVYTKLTVSQGDNLDFRQTSYLFDTFERLIQKTTKGDKEDYINRYEYDYLGNNTKIIDEVGNETTIEYDTFGNKTHIINAEGIEEFYGYNYIGKMIWSKNGENKQTYSTYDSLGREIKKEIPYDSKGKYSVIKQYYDGRNNIVKTIDAEGNKKEYEFNERNLLSKASEYSSATDGITSGYQYDNEGRVLTLTIGSIKNADERKSFKNRYDHFGRLTERIDNMKQKQYYEYDSIGNMTKFTDRNGNNTSFEYDGLNRNTRAVNSKEGEKSFEYNEFGQILNIVDNGSKIEYNYNARGNIESIVRDLSNESFVYDSKGNVTDHYIEDKDIGTIATGYEYDKLNRVTKVYTELGVQSISYDKANRIVKSENNKNGMSKSYTYSPQGTVNTIKTRQDDKLVYSEYYEYDKNGNKTYSDENGNIKKYNYDGMGRLQRVVDNNAVQTEYEFDAYNNISKEYQLVGTDVSTKSYYYDANNRLTLATTKYDVEQFDYDKEGNLTHKKEGFGQNVSTTYYKYDGYNRLENVISETTEAEYHYNIEGLRDKKTVDGITTRFTYDGDKIAGEYTEGEYYKYYRANELIGYVNNIDEGYYYGQNSHGDVTAILDYQGKELKSYDYTPYGKQKEIQIEPKGSKTIVYQWEKETDKTHNPFKYAGEYQDEETGNIYLRARYYDVSVGRFTQEDPVKDGLNWYGYCGNNPVNRWDPSGLATIQDMWQMEKENPGILQKISDADPKNFISNIAYINESYKIKKSFKSRVKDITNGKYLQTEFYSQAEPAYSVEHKDYFREGKTLSKGCAFFVSAVAISWINNDTINRALDLAYESGGSWNGSGLIGDSVPQAFGQYCSQYANFITVNPCKYDSEAPLTFEQIKENIDSGFPIITSVRYWPNGDSSAGHYCVITGYQIINGKGYVLVNDVNGKNKYKKESAGYEKFKFVADKTDREKGFSDFGWDQTVTFSFK